MSESKLDIRVEYIYPPIPTRNHDWCAYDYNRQPDGPVGYGATSKEAVAEFFELLAMEEEEIAEEEAKNGQFGVGA